MGYQKSRNAIVKSLAATALIIASLAATSAQAEFVSIDDWHLTSDAFGGLKQSFIADDIYFAVAQSNYWNPSDEYEMLPGFRWATSAEYAARAAGQPVDGRHTYYNQGGWSGYVWEGLTRYIFKFADTRTTRIAKHAGNYDTHYNITYYNSYVNNYHAGFVLLRTSTAVAEPGTLGLVALGIAGLGFMARRRKAIAQS